MSTKNIRTVDNQTDIIFKCSNKNWNRARILTELYQTVQNLRTTITFRDVSSVNVADICDGNDIVESVNSSCEQNWVHSLILEHAACAVEEINGNNCTLDSRVQIIVTYKE